MMKSILTTIVFLALAVAGLAQTRNVIVNTNGVVQSPTNFWSADASNARTGLGLGSAATNPASAFQPSSLALSNLSSSSLGVSGTLAISNGGTGATNASTARTNLGLGLPALTNSDSNSFRSAIGLGISNSVSFESVSAVNGSIKVLEGTNEVVLLNPDEAAYFAYPINFLNTNALNSTRDHLGLKRIVTTDQGQSGWITEIYDDTNATNPIIAVGGQAGVTLYGPIGFSGASTITNRAISRNSLGLGWSALTNTNTSGFNASLYGSGTNPVLYNTNGEVVSPTNFWQVAPISTTVQYQTNVTATSTNAATNARKLYLYSLTPTVSGVTNTVTLPTNSATFVGDVATIIHEGPTNSFTAIRQIGSATNIISLNQFQEAVQFIYNGGGWKLADNISHIEPIYFSGTNALANAAASRTNLGLGWLALTNPQSSLASGVATKLLGYVPEVTSGGTNITGNNVVAYTNTNTLVIPANILISGDAVPSFRDQKNIALNGTVTIRTPLSSPTTIYANNSITATDDSSYTNVVVSFGSNSVGFSNVTASGTLTATSTVTAKTNLVVEGFVNYTAARTNNTPTNIPNFAAHAAWIEVKVGTNSFFLPAYQ